MGEADAMIWKVSISYHAAAIIAGLLPGRQEHLSNEAKRAVIELLGQVVRTRNQITAEQENGEEDAS
jgi:hypothetical protein